MRASIILVLLLLGSSSARAASLEVVTSISILADLVREVGGQHVHVTSLIGADGDAHVYQPTPNDARRLAAARLVVVNGLGLDGWIDRLVASAGYRGPIVTASAGVDPILVGGTPDPHAWQDVGSTETYARNIATALATADPADADDFAARRDQYLTELADLDRWIRARIETVPEARRRIVTSHDAFHYFGRAYHVRFFAPVGVNEDSEPTARDVAALIRQIRAEHITALFVETRSDPRLIREIARETDARIGGSLRTDSLSPPGDGADTYLAFMRANVETLMAGLGGG